jgi:hypothetical protein
MVVNGQILPYVFRLNVVICLRLTLVFDTLYMNNEQRYRLRPRA